MIGSYRPIRGGRGLRIGLAIRLASSAVAGSLHAATVVNDSWADAGRTNGADPQDAAWWSSTASNGNAIEVSLNNLGLISGTSGRGIHGTFAPQALAEGERMTVTFTFITPGTVGTNLSAGFRIGLFNRSNNPALEADLTASSGSPNALYNPLAGYMLDFDVNPTIAADANISFREKDPVPGTTGQLVSTTTGFASMGSGGGPYAFTGSTLYTGVYSVGRTASGLELSASLSNSSGVLSSFSTTDASASATTFDLLAFHANSNAFGNNTTAGDPNNGINFSNITIDVSPIPEPGAALLATGLAALAFRRRRA